MREKIKSLARIFLRGSIGGWRGLVGLALTIFSVYLLTGLFSGTTNVQNYIRNKRELGQIDARIEAAQTALETRNRHIRLLAEGSPDFVSEMAAKHLNLGNPDVMILKK